MSCMTVRIDQPRRLNTDTTLMRGLLMGLAAASIGALYTVFARWGIAHGMDSADMTDRQAYHRPIPAAIARATASRYPRTCCLHFWFVP